MTSYKVTWLRFLKQRHLLLAYIYGIRASWMKSAACRRVNQVWYIARYSYQLSSSIQTGHRFEQRLGVWVLRVKEYGSCISRFLDLACIYYSYIFSRFSYYSHIMSY